MADLFRKAALDRISSPEQLDKMVVITPPRLWIALLGAGLIIGCALIWSIAGRLPVSVEADGVYVNSGGAAIIYAEGSGVVADVLVSEGQTVEDGELLATINSQQGQKEIAELKSRIAAVEAMTFTSENDIVIADNQQMSDIKAQALGQSGGAGANRGALNLRQSQLAQQRALVAELKVKMDAAAQAYYATLVKDGGNLAQFEYQTATSDYSYKHQAYGTAASILNNYKSQYESVEREMLVYEDQLRERRSQIRDEIEADEFYQDASQDEIDQAVDEYVDTDPTAQELSMKIRAYGIQLDELADALEEAEDDLSDAAEELEDAEDQVDSAASAYEHSISQSQLVSQESSQAQTAFQMAQNEYNTALNTLNQLEDNASQLQVQVQSDGFTSHLQNAAYELQFTNAKAATLSQLRSELDRQLAAMEKTEIRANVSGAVFDVAIANGAVIGSGSEVLRLMLGDPTDMRVVLYLPVQDGKKISEGMEVMVHPSTVSKQEYGHMKAKVSEVSEYVASTASMQAQLGNDALVNAFSQQGPMIKVVCELIEDENTASGYAWSSKKGATVKLRSSTIVSATIVTEKKAPITMLIPFLKEKLTVHTADEDDR